MKKFIIITVLLVGFFATLYYWNQYEKSSEQHPAIHSAAGKPDDYLLEVKDYEDKHRHNKSAIKIEQAIQAIWKLEKDVDDDSFERLEQTIAKLEMVHRRILRDSIPYPELILALEYALNNLAHVELEVAANYSASNQSNETKSALKYSQLHIKNALILHNPNVLKDSILLNSEVSLLNQIDSLLNMENFDQPDYTASLDKLITQLDDIILRIENQ